MILRVDPILMWVTHSLTQNRKFARGNNGTDSDNGRLNSDQARLNGLETARLKSPD